MASKTGAAWDFRSCIAFLMACVAFLGALAAYEAATAADRLAAATRLLDEGQVLSLDKRQFYLDSIARNVLYAERAQTLGNEAAAVETISDNRVLAQEDRAAKRLIERYERYYNRADPNRSLEGELQKWTANDLGALGFNVSWQRAFDDPKTTLQPNIWAAEDDVIAGLGRDFKLLALAVALYVLTMLFLTAADVTHAKRRAVLLLAGVATAAVATVVFATRVNDTPAFGPLPTVGLLLVGVLVGAAFAIVAFARAMQSADEPELDVPAAEFGPSDFIGSRLFTRLTEGRFSQTVVITIAATCTPTPRSAPSPVRSRSSNAVGQTDWSRPNPRKTHRRALKYSLPGPIVRTPLPSSIGPPCIRRSRVLECTAPPRAQPQDTQRPDALLGHIVHAARAPVAHLTYLRGDGYSRIMRRVNLKRSAVVLDRVFRSSSDRRVAARRQREAPRRSEGP